jgi:hypothetical protein
LRWQHCQTQLLTIGPCQSRGQGATAFTETTPTLENIWLSDKQGTFGQSRFLDACRAYNRGELTQTQLVEQTARLGFSNVLDAFHVVNQGEVPVRFFTDEGRYDVIEPPPARRVPWRVLRGR